MIKYYFVRANFVLGIIFLLLTTNCYGSENTTTLKLVHVFFRHGTRTPRESELYPNDPHKSTVFLQGYGELTNAGKMKAFKLGKFLRARYDTFLGERFKRDSVYVRSTEYERTKASALLVLAGLFPPTSSEIWNENLNWLPISYDYKEWSKDFELMRPHLFCPAYNRELNNVLNAEEVQALLCEHRSTLEYVSKHAGKPIETLFDVLFLNMALIAEDNMNLTLPEWTKPIYPDFLHDLGSYVFYFDNATPFQKRINGGRLIKILNKDLLEKCRNLLEPKDRKIFLYSAHDSNIASILSTLNIFKSHSPVSSSALLFELHHLNASNQYFLKVIYIRNDVPEEQVIPGCGDVLCPLEKFFDLTQNYIPGNLTQECESPILLE